MTSKRSPKDGRERIYIHCQAGCSGDAIMRTMGLTARDLIVDPDAPARPAAAKAQQETTPAAKPQRAQQPKADPAEDPKPPIDFAHPDAVYSYTDAQGRELFQVCRYSYLQNGKREKTFRQRMRDPGNPKANRDGYVHSVPNTLRESTLYNMPAVAAAIREGRPLYVVEGEKDVATMTRLGMAATCNAGGAGKWRDSYSELLRGADLIILPDCDTAENGYAGQNHALDVAMKSLGIARRVRLINILEACPDLPPKGDISDMAALMGDNAATEALARQVAATRDFDPNDVPFWLSPFEQAERLYSLVPGYGAVNGCIVQIQSGDTQKTLSDFVVIPRQVLTQDDGVSVNTSFVMEGYNSRRRRLGRVTISSKELDAMSWVTARWGFDASMAPGSSAREKVAWCIKKVGQITAHKVTEYNHTGWRKIDGKWCYLYHGGAIGAEGITVNLGDALMRYRLDGSGAQGFDRIPVREAAQKSLMLQQVMKPEIGIALLGTVYLAPLREFLLQANMSPSYSLFLYGESGTPKTTAAALALSHFGNFKYDLDKPASFHDTSNSIRRKAFTLKDMPLLVDDYHPSNSQQERKQMMATAQALSRAFGDGADRARLNSDGSIRPAMPPRCTAIITGEDLPAIGASGLARFCILDIDREDIPVNDTLTDLQTWAEQGYLQRAMRGYITWLRAQADELPQRLREAFIQIRRLVRDENPGLHDRAPETTAYILVGYQMMLLYMRDAGVFDSETVRGMLEDAHETLTNAGRRQARTMESEKPTRIFMDSLVELKASKSIAFRDITGDPEAEKPNSTQDMVGYVDSRYYYLLPQIAFSCVSRLCREQGIEFPVSLKALYKHLRTDGVVDIQAESDQITRPKRIDGQVMRLLWIPRSALNEMDGGQKLRQVEMDMDFSHGNPDDLPDGWK